MSDRLKVATVVPGWLRSYDAGWLRPDLVAGLTLAAYLLPAGIGDASLAGLPPEAGLYACLFSGLVFWIFCSSRQTVVTVTSALSLLVGASIGEMSLGDPTRHAALAAVLALMISAIAIAAWLIRAGTAVGFFSETVLVGFKAGLAFYLASTQLPKLFGFAGSHGDFWERAAQFLAHLGDTQPVALLLGVVALAALLAGKRWLRDRPVAFAVVVLAIVAARVFDVQAHGVALLGQVPQGLPSLGVAAVSRADLNALLPAALAGFVLAAVETSAIGRMFAQKHGYRFDPNKELLALGAANLFTGVGRAFPVSGGMSQSLVNESGGARSPLSGLVAALFTLFVVLFASGLLRNLPQPVLAAVVLAAVMSLVDVAALRAIWHFSRAEFLIAAVAFLWVLGSGPANGVLLGAGLSIVLLLQQASRPRVTELGRVAATGYFADLARHSENERTPGVLIIRCESALVYFNVEHVKDRVFHLLAARPDPVRLVMFSLGAVPRLDLAGAELLAELGTVLERRGIAFRVSDAHGQVRGRTAPRRLRTRPRRVEHRADDRRRAGRVATRVRRCRARTHEGRLTMRMRLRPLALTLATVVLALSPALAASQTMTPAQIPSATAAPADPEADADRAAPVLLEGEPILWITVGAGPYSAALRADRISRRIEDAVHDRSLRDPTITVTEVDQSSELRAGSRLLMVVTARDAASLGASRTAIAQHYAVEIETAIRTERLRYAPTTLIRSGVYGVIATVALLIALWLASRASRRIQHVLTRALAPRSQYLRLMQAELLPADRLARTVITATRATRALLTLLAIDLYLTYVLGLFPWTRAASHALFGYVMTPVEAAATAFVGYLPNLLFLVVIGGLIYASIRLVALFFRQVADGRLAFASFPAEWADPTNKIVRVLLIAFGLVVAFPYLPAANSPAFAGVSVFLGILISLASSSALSNMIAGIVLTYTGAFRMGDIVKLGDSFGTIVETALLATHIRTLKNEEVTIPNSIVLGSAVVNYSRGSKAPGLVLHTSVTIGYDAPWHRVHELLVSAALRVPDVLHDPPPFVWQTALNDFYVTYEINAYTSAPEHMMATYAALHAAIQDTFFEAGVEIMSPHYTAVRDGNVVAIPEALRAPGYQPSAFRIADTGALGTGAVSRERR